MSLFIAVWPDHPAMEVLGALARPPRRGVRWTDSEHWHVTLAFLGAVALDQAVDALSRLEQDPVPAAGLGPSVRLLNRTVLVVPVSGLDRLAESVQVACRQAGMDMEERPFRGHLTLARGRHPRDLAGLAGEPVSARFPVSAVDLVSSRPASGGGPNRYEVLRRLDLGDHMV